jgi:endoglucanase
MSLLVASCIVSLNEGIFCMGNGSTFPMLLDKQSIYSILKMSLFYKTSIDIVNAIKPYVSETCIDVLGNIIAHKSGVGKCIMLVAHHDVVCLMVSNIDEDGFLYVKPAGFIDVSILQARKVIIRHGEKSIIGIIGKRPIHLIHDNNSNKVAFESLWIDIGAKSRPEALQMVSKGDYAYFCSDYETMPNNIITGSYLDDQIGLNVLLKLAEELSNKEMHWDAYFVASNHEEIGMRGAPVVAHSIRPDICICIDVTHATDYPTMNHFSDGDIKLGQGCVLAKGPDIYPALFNELEKVAIKQNIMYQIEVSPYPTGTDANVIQQSGNGVKTAVVSIPCRYMHTPNEVCSVNDIEAAINLIASFMREEGLLR